MRNAFHHTTLTNLTNLVEELEGPPSSCAPDVVIRLQERIRRSTRSARRRTTERRIRKAFRRGTRESTRA